MLQFALNSASEATLTSVDRQLEDTIRANLEQEFPDAALQVVVEGNRCLVRVVTDEFEGVLRVRREQRVYRCLTELMASGELHAVTIQAKTSNEASSE
ncbi:MAG: BolA/IbaG family iron-sulfur metabolism protein [Gammaproteobacteria bacterium]|nr:BolA/IbaG family iron-sulfur metabolism protein [Gammaproteobacteria bacterium]